MTFAVSRESIETAFRDAWFAVTDTPLTFDNTRGFFTTTGYTLDSIKESEFVRLTIKPVDTQTITLGANPETRTRGLVMVQVFVKEGTGSGRAFALADVVASILQNKLIDGIQFMATSMVNVGPQNGYYQVNATTRYWVTSFS